MVDCFEKQCAVGQAHDEKTQTCSAEENWHKNLAFRGIGELHREFHLTGHPKMRKLKTSCTHKKFST